MKNWLDHLRPKKINKTDQLILREIIKRSATYTEAFEQWLTTNAPITLNKLVKEAIAFNTQGLIHDLHVQELKSIYSNGIAIPFQPAYFTKETYSFYFDYLGYAILEKLDYRQTLSELKIIDKSSTIHEFQKKYFKPRLKVTDTIFKQQFGNTTLEMTLKQDQPQHLKLSCAIYNGNQYSEPRPFEELINILFH